MNFLQIKKGLKKILNKSKSSRIVVTYEKFLESLYHLNYYSNQLFFFQSALDKYNVSKLSDEKDQVAFALRISVQSVTLINACSIMDEMSNYLFAYKSGSKDLKRRIKAYKKITAPIRNEMEKWPDIRKFRNHVLAHNLRDNGNRFQSVFRHAKLNQYIIPNSTKELLILITAFQLILKPLIEIFALELAEAQQIIELEDETKPSKSIVDLYTNWNQAIIKANVEIAKYNARFIG